MQIPKHDHIFASTVIPPSKWLLAVGVVGLVEARHALAQEFAAPEPLWGARLHMMPQNVAKRLGFDRNGTQIKAVIQMCSNLEGFSS